MMTMVDDEMFEFPPDFDRRNDDTSDEAMPQAPRSSADEEEWTVYNKGSNSTVMSSRTSNTNNNNESGATSVMTSRALRCCIFGSMIVGMVVVSVVVYRALRAYEDDDDAVLVFADDIAMDLFWKFGIWGAIETMSRVAVAAGDAAAAAGDTAASNNSNEDFQNLAATQSIWNHVGIYDQSLSTTPLYSYFSTEGETTTTTDLSPFQQIDTQAVVVSQTILLDSIPTFAIVYPIQSSAGSSLLLFATYTWASILNQTMPTQRVVITYNDAADTDNANQQFVYDKTAYIGPTIPADWKPEDTSATTNIPETTYSVSSYYIEAEVSGSENDNRTSIGVTILIGVMFFITILVFIAYDIFLEQKQRLILQNAEKSHAIVASLFPKSVRKRMFEDSKHGARNNNMLNNNSNLNPAYNTATTASMMMESSNNNGVIKMSSKPIADLFSHTTVLFADIAGFTAWSSTREPSQVFTLLESIYGAFDALAERRKVFKVETIGDSYVAVTGLPDPQPDHAIIMSKFAVSALSKFNSIMQELEVALGPDTTDLKLRIGFHSGPVTAGVLRGQKSRFQLFGDTVNTASRMESTGKPNFIQCSQASADCLVEYGKAHWIVARQDEIAVKGKGIFQTYWVRITSGSNAPALSSALSHSSATSMHDEFANDPKKVTIPQNPVNDFKNSMRAGDGNISGDVHMTPHLQRLLEWNVDLLSTLLKRVVAHRLNNKERKGIMNMALTISAGGPVSSSMTSRRSSSMLESMSTEATNPRDEYRESIQLPHFVESSVAQMVDSSDIELKQAVETQLRDYVTEIACSYRDNPFHNYDHASHVTMSTNKILMRVVRGADLERATIKDMSTAASKTAAELHDYTYGITSDPLTHFACVFAALIHDVDHPGIPNAQLIKEKDPMALKYVNKSVAEQNSLDLSWNLLMDVKYQDLRKCLFDTDESRKRFRQLLVNIVMATDIFDPDLQRLRNQRWDKAFATSPAGTSQSNEGSVDGSLELPQSNLRATIVIEHILQAADVSHTMQHWHVYQKWNRRLFQELYRAYKEGHLGNDPSAGWYKGELWFYDNYVLPLAQKLSDCGVFGVSSDEFYNYAKMNRLEWEQKGEAIVESLKAECEEEDEKQRQAQMLNGDIVDTHKRNE